MSSDDEDNYEYNYSDSDNDNDNSDNDSASGPTTTASPGFQTPQPTRSNPNAAPVSSPRDTTAPNPLGLYSTPTDKNPHGIRLLDATELVQEISAAVADVVDMLDVPDSAGHVMLRGFKWNKERLIDAYMENPELTLSKSGVALRVAASRNNGETKEEEEKGEKTPTRSSRRLQATTSTTSTASPIPVAAASFPEGVCGICCDDELGSSDMFALPGCGEHKFCNGCWAMYVKSKVTDGPTCVYMTCPAAGCKELVTEDEVGAVAPTQVADFGKYQLRSFVDLNKNVRWCPGLDCDKIASSRSGGGDITCTCGTGYCVRCGEEPHQPVVCKSLALWLEKCQNESETANWILANTKKCPKCYTRIEKNQGCNHMACQQCRFEFCWICLGEWQEHGAGTGGYYKCNKFAEEKDGEDQSDAAKAKRELDRYLHYYQRYHAHEQAQKFAKKQLAQTEQRMIQLQDSTATEQTSWIDVQFLKSAVEQLIECRRVLKCTYTFAYYLTDAGKKERFEHHQEMLEKFTEKLSELSEQPIEKMNRTDVVNHTRVVDKFMVNILRYVEDGMDEDE